MISSTDQNSIDRAFAQPIQSTTLARWERKALQSKRKSARTPSNSKTPGKQYSGRFIPNRESSNSSMQLHHVTNNENLSGANNVQADNQLLRSKLAQTIMGADDAKGSRILSFKQKAPKPTEAHHNNMRVLYTQNRSSAPIAKKAFRHIDSTPSRILDAPDLLDDYYLNLLDWSCGNQVAVALGCAVYLWDAGTGNIELLCENEEDDNNITSVSFMNDGTHLAIGNNYNSVQLYDVERKAKVRTMNGHAARVSSLAWNNYVLSSGSRDSNIFNHDVRIANHHISTLGGHQQEVCGLKWSPDGSQLASGANDNMCMIWDAGQSTARHQFADANAAVKALAWCPFERNILATGAGTADRHIRFYNTMTGTCVNKIDTGSQVCSLVWSPTEKEILSGHGYSENQLTLWKYPTMARVAELTGHSQRVLHMAISADGRQVCSAAADETLRFWNIWDHKPAKKKSTKAATHGRKSSIMRTLR